MIRVLHYGMGPNLGGIETYLLNLTRTIDSSRFACDFVYTDQGRPPVFAAELEPLGSRFFGITPRRTSPRRNRADLEALFARERFDILHFHANTTSYVAPVKAARRHNVPVIYHSHNAGASRSRMTRALHWWNQRTLPWDAITKVAVSSEAGRWMFAHRSFEVIHNGIDVNTFKFRPEARAAVRDSLGIASEAFVVGSVAAFLPAKNHSFILAVFAEVLQRRPDAHLLLVGDGPLEQETRERAHKLGLGEHVSFLGRRPDVPKLLSSMDVLLMPSVHEGFPVVVVEAQAAGLPCFLSTEVTPEVALSTSCRRLALKDQPGTWADTLVTSPPADRLAGGAIVKLAGLTTEANAAAVAAIYEQAHTS